MMLRFGRRAALVRYWRGTRGAAAAEFALVATVMAIPLLNVLDLGTYVYKKMEMQNAVQIGAQEASLLAATCSLPLTTGNCSGSYSGSIGAAVHGGTLGANVTVSSITENYYCVNGSGNLVVTGSLGSRANCSDGQPAGDYVLVTGSYSYAPIFTGVSVTGLLTTPITSTVWMRLS